MQRRVQASLYLLAADQAPGLIKTSRTARLSTGGDAPLATRTSRLEMHSMNPKLAIDSANPAGISIVDQAIHKASRDFRQASLFIERRAELARATITALIRSINITG